MSIGASGLGRGLARGLIAASATAASASTEAMGEPVGGRTACLAGSCSQATLTQIERAERAMPVLNSIPTGSSADRRKCNARSRGRANISIRDPSCLQAVPRPIELRPYQARHGRAATGHAIDQAMATIAVGLLDRGVRRLVIAGADRRRGRGPSRHSSISRGPRIVPACPYCVRSVPSPMRWCWR